MSNITTCGLIMGNSSRNIKIESKKINSQCIPYFFSSVNRNIKSSSKVSKTSVKNK